jgi:hypothetical protein
MSKLKTVLEASECHTLDRDDFRAQRDSCGIKPGKDWDDAIDAMFKVKYHAWVQDSKVRACVEEVFDDSPVNQARSDSTRLFFQLGNLALALMGMLAITYL